MPRPASAAAHKVRLINQLTHTKGPFAGQPFRLRSGKSNGLSARSLPRIPPQAYGSNACAYSCFHGKMARSELAAALAIDGLLFDGEIGAEVYSAAADKDQAGLVFNVAAQMIRQQSRALRRM